MSSARDFTGVAGAIFASASVAALLACEMARLRGDVVRARGYALLALPVLVGFGGVVVIRFFDLL